MQRCPQRCDSGQIRTAEIINDFYAAQLGDDGDDKEFASACRSKRDQRIFDISFSISFLAVRAQ